MILSCIPLLFLMLGCFTHIWLCISSSCYIYMSYLCVYICQILIPTQRCRKKVHKINQDSHHPVQLLLRHKHTPYNRRRSRADCIITHKLWFLKSFFPATVILMANKPWTTCNHIKPLSAITNHTHTYTNIHTSHIGTNAQQRNYTKDVLCLYLKFCM